MLAMEAKIADLSLERTVHIISHVYNLHKYDQNFPGAALQRMSDFLNNPDVHERPDKHVELVDEMKMEAILSTENSPYAEVRANCDPTDDPTMPSLTIRVWVIGCVFSAAGSFIDSFFLMRNPPVYIGANVAQLLSCEYLSRLWDRAHRKTLAESSWHESCQTSASSYSVGSTV
jgi:hypothetical protein